MVEALHRNLPIDSTQAVRKRTRAGMGHCQGDEDNYNCECRVAAIIARENKIPVEALVGGHGQRQPIFHSDGSVTRSERA